MTTHQPTNPISPSADCLPLEGVVEVSLLLLESHLGALQDRASQGGMTTGELIRRVIACFLTTKAELTEVDVSPVDREARPTE